MDIIEKNLLSGEKMYPFIMKSTDTIDIDSSDGMLSFLMTKRLSILLY